MIVLRLSGNAVPGAVSLFELGHHSAIVLLLASMLSLILPLDFVLVFYCSTMISSPQSCWHTLLCYG